MVTASLISGCGDEVPPLPDRQVKVVSTCWLDFIDKNNALVVRVKQGQVSFLGWMAGSSKSGLDDKLALELKSSTGRSYLYEESVRMVRPDVARALRNDQHLNAGFRFVAQLSGVERGVYGISIRLQEPDGVLRCNIKKNLIVE